MILRRIARSLLGRDWSTLLLELVVVVIGILLGLRLDDWNEARKEADREVVYLERLLADVEEMRLKHQRFADNSRVLIEEAFLTRAALTTCRLDEAVAAAFERTLIGHQFLPRLEIVRSTYDEMVATGVLAGLADAELKRTISETYTQAGVLQEAVDYFSADLGRASDIIWRHVTFGVSGENPGGAAESAPSNRGPYTQTVEYELDALCASSVFGNAIVEVFDSRTDRQTVGDRFDASLATLQQALRERLSAAG